MDFRRFKYSVLMSKEFRKCWDFCEWLWFQKSVSGVYKLCAVDDIENSQPVLRHHSNISVYLGVHEMMWLDLFLCKLPSDIVIAYLIGLSSKKASEGVMWKFVGMYSRLKRSYVITWKDCMWINDCCGKENVGTLLCVRMWH